MADMKMMEKAIARAKSLGINQANLARSVGVDPARISEWKDETRSNKPSIWQALTMARVLGVSMESLVDDEMELTANEVDQDDRFVVRTYRALGLSADEAVRLLNSGITIDAGSVKYRGTDVTPPASGRSSDRRSG